MVVEDTARLALLFRGLYGADVEAASAREEGSEFLCLDEHGRG